MAGLGIGAGAFEGDNARKEQQQRDAQLGLQAASLQQQGRQADMQDSRARMGMALDQQNRKAELAFGQQRMGEQSRQFDAGLGLDQQRQAEQRRQFDTGLGLDQQRQAEQRRQFDTGIQMRGSELQRADRMDAFNQEQTLRKNDWEDVLNSDKLRVADMQYQELLKLRDEEDRQRKERDSAAKSAVGQMIRAAYEGGGVPGQNFLSASQLEYFKKMDPRFQGLQGVTWGDDGKGGKVLQMVMQGPNGEPMAETITPEQQYLALSSLYGQKMADGIFGRTDKAAYNAYLMDRGQSLEQNVARRMSEIDKTKFDSATRMFLEASKNYDEDGKAAASKMMDEISRKYEGVGQQQQVQSQEPQKEDEQLIKARKIAAEVKKANPYANKERLRELVRKALTSAGITVN